MSDLEFPGAVRTDVRGRTAVGNLPAKLLNSLTLKIGLIENWSHLRMLGGGWVEVKWKVLAPATNWMPRCPSLRSAVRPCLPCNVVIRASHGSSAISKTDASSLQLNELLPALYCSMRVNVQKTTERGRGGATAATAPRSIRLAATKRAHKPSRRGFAAMDPKLQRRIARQGGRTVSRDRKHMAEIGRIGGGRSHGAKRR